MRGCVIKFGTAFFCGAFCEEMTFDYEVNLIFAWKERRYRCNRIEKMLLFITILNKMG